MSSVSRNFAQGAPSIKNVELTGNGTYSSPAVAEVDLRVSSVFTIDCSDLEVTNDYSQVYIDTESGASGSLPGKEVTFVFKTAEDENGKNTQSLVITFSPDFTKESSVSYTTGVNQLNPNPVITLVSDGEKFSVKTMNYMKSSADPFNPLTNKLLLIGRNNDSHYALSRNNGTTWDIQQVGGYRALDEVEGFAWNGSAWVVVGDDGNSPDICLLYSTDAINWVAPSGNQPFRYDKAYAIAWNDTLKLWIAGGYSGDGYALAYSPTGYDNWQWKEYESTDPIGNNDGTVRAIATSAEYCVAVAYSNNRANTICRSTNGIDWVVAVTNPFNNENGEAYTVATNGNIWVAGGYRNDQTVSLVWSENNGVDWYACTSVGGGNDPFSISATNGRCLSVATNGTMWVAGGYGINLNGDNPDTTISLAYSFNGKEWTAVTGDLFSIQESGSRAVVWNGSAWFAASFNKNSPILTSQDGIHWTPVSANPFDEEFEDPDTDDDDIVSFGIKHVLPFTPGLPSGLLSANELAVRAEKKAARKAVRDQERAKKDSRSNVSHGRRAEKSVVDASGTRVGRESRASRGPRGPRGPRESRAEKSVVDVSGTRVARVGRESRGPRDPRAEKSVVDVSGTRVGREQRNRRERSRGNRNSRRVAIVEPVAPVPVAVPIVTVEPVAVPVAEPVAVPIVTVEPVAVPVVATA